MPSPSPSMDTSNPPRLDPLQTIAAQRISLQRRKVGAKAEDSPSRRTRAVSMAASARLRAAPVSPVRLTFQQDNWAQASNARIEDAHKPRSGVTDPRRQENRPRSPDALSSPPHDLSYDAGPESRGQRRLSLQQSMEKPLPSTFPVDLPHRTRAEEDMAENARLMQSGTDMGAGVQSARWDQEKHRVGHKSHSHDLYRHSGDTDTTGSSQQQDFTDTSVETSASSVCQDQDGKSQDGDDDDAECRPVPQLQYHHAATHARVSSVPLEAMTRPPNSSDLELVPQGQAIKRHLTPSSYFRRSSLPRPSSAYSTISDAGSRGRSPGSRSASAHSRRSPERRAQSTYAELLNVPYPQPGPAPFSLDNSQLRSNVGSLASLLSTETTLEMYRQNVKKTHDQSIQYSFAVFLISTAQEYLMSAPQELQQGRSDAERRPSSSKLSKTGHPSQAGTEHDRDAADSSPAALVREAKNILTRLANGGYPFAQYYLGDGYASGLFSDGKENYDAAFPLFVLAAKHGHAESSYRTALCYEFGWGCRKDPAKSVQHLRTASSRSHPGAMTRLGKAFLSGDLGETRYREGLKWLRRAAECADTIYNDAPYQLALLYESGYGDDVFKDEPYAAELFTQAAELGHVEASFRMGDAYEFGKLGCPRDPALSVHFYTGAAQAGHSGAMMGLCAWYMVGAEPHLDKDEEEAYEWARSAANLGNTKAQYTVGFFTEMGIGCRRDILEANVWYVKAADAGEDRARQRLAAIRAAVSGGGTPMEVAPPRNPKMTKSPAKEDKDCVVM